jgi:Flp pilus assembly protein TadD
VSSSVNTSKNRGRSAWIISPAADLVLLIASPLAIVPLVSWLSSVYFSAEQISLAVVSFASIGHHLPGFLRAYSDQSLFRRFRWRLLLAPPLVLAVALVFSWYDFKALSLVLLFWATWHVLMQTYGFMRIYDMKQGQTSAPAAWLDFLLCLSIFISGVLFSDARVYGIAEVLWETGFPLFGPAALHTARIAVGATTGVIIAAYLAQTVIARIQGQQINWIKLLLISSTGWLYWTSGAISQDILVGVALFEIFHALQYNAIVWAYNCSSTRRDPSSMGRLSLFFQDRAGWLCIYVAAIFAYGALNMGTTYVPATFLQQIARACLVTSTLLHFYFDGFIWKVSEANVQANLAINQPAKQRRTARALWHPAALAALVLFAFLWESPAKENLASSDAAILSHLYQLTPQLPEVQSRVAHDALNRGDKEEALRLATNVVRLRPNSPQAHADLGLAMLQSGDYPGAASSFRAAISLDPSTWQNHCDLGTALARSKQWEAAERAYARADQLRPRSSTVHHLWGQMCAMRGDNQGAIQHWLKAIEDDPMASAARESLVTALTAIGDHVQAKAIAEQGVSLEGTSRSHVNLGAALIAASQSQESTQPPSQATAGQDDAQSVANPQYDLTAAQHSLVRAIELDPNNADAYFHLGNAQQMSGDLSAATKSYRRCTDLKPGHAEAYANLGAALARQQDSKHAEAAYRQSLQLAPNAPGTNYNLGLLLLENHRTKEAADYFKRAEATTQTPPAESSENLTTN